MGLVDWLKKKRSPSLNTMNTMFLSRSALEHNFHLVQSLKPDDGIFPVVKSNAYGHGLYEVATILGGIPNIPFVCADSYVEYQRIKKYTPHRVLIIGETNPENYDAFDWRRTSFAVYSLRVLNYLIEKGKKVRIHIFLNTGMNREGVQEQVLREMLRRLEGQDHIVIEGVMSHLAMGDQPSAEFTKKQVTEFKRLGGLIEQAGHRPKWRHLGNSPGIGKIDDSYFTGWRTGKAFYGYQPLEEYEPDAKKFINLTPVLSVVSTVVSEQRLDEGDIVSYSGTYVASGKERVVTIPFGYHEGLQRSLSNKREMKRNDKRLPQIGNICMNLCSLSARDVAIQVGDQIEVIGSDPDAKNSLRHFAHIAKTIQYEILVGFDEKMRRTIIN